MNETRITYGPPIAYRQNRVYDMSYYLFFLKKPFLKFFIYKMDIRHSLVKQWENAIAEKH